jgi:hypothetical protein
MRVVRLFVLLRRRMLLIPLGLGIVPDPKSGVRRFFRCGIA